MHNTEPVTRPQNPRSSSFDILLTDYFSTSAFPLTVPESSSDSTESPFTSLLATPTRLTDLITLYRLNILQPLIPGLRKEGYSELPQSASSATTSASGSGSGNVGRAGGPYYPDTGGPMGVMPGGSRQPAPAPAAPPHHPPRSPDDRDPLRIPGSGNRPNPYDIGRSDLLPLGGMGGTFAGPLGAGVGGGLGGGGGGGMYMGRDHPLFRDRFSGDGSVGGGAPQGHGGQGRLWGGDGYLPSGAVPPGARFDPVGPGVS